MPHAPAPTGNVALLIDADNAGAAYLDSVLTVLAEFGTVNVRRAYGNWTKPGLQSWVKLLMRHGIEPYQQFDITKGKNATDMRMTIDAMDLLLRGNVTGIGLMSSDSDFMPLAQRIRQEGVPVYGFGTDRTPEGFRESCTRFLDVASLDVEDVANMPIPPSIGNGGTPAPSGPVPVRAEPAQPPRKQKVDAKLVKLLADAYEASRIDKTGFASLGEVGQRVANRSSFDVRNYGFKRLSDLVEKVSEFQIERRDNGVYVKPR